MKGDYCIIKLRLSADLAFGIIGMQLISDGIYWSAIGSPRYDINNRTMLIEMHQYNNTWCFEDDQLIDYLTVDQLITKLFFVRTFWRLIN